MAVLFPEDFSVPLDQGGPGNGQPIGGFGGNTALGRPGHRAVVQRVGKAPVVFSDFLPLLNAVPPAPSATTTVSPHSEGHPSALEVALSIVPGTGCSIPSVGVRPPWR